MPGKERFYNKFSNNSWYSDALGKFWLFEGSEYLCTLQEVPLGSWWRANFGVLVEFPHLFKNKFKKRQLTAKPKLQNVAKTWHAASDGGKIKQSEVQHSKVKANSKDPRRRDKGLVNISIYRHTVFVLFCAKHEHVCILTLITHLFELLETFKFSRLVPNACSFVFTHCLGMHMLKKFRTDNNWLMLQTSNKLKNLSPL